MTLIIKSAQSVKSDLQDFLYIIWAMRYLKNSHYLQHVRRNYQWI